MVAGTTRDRIGNDEHTMPFAVVAVWGDRVKSNQDPDPNEQESFWYMIPFSVVGESVQSIPLQLQSFHRSISGV